MWLALGFLGLVLTAQIPPPALGAGVAQDLKEQRRAILNREGAALSVLAERLDREKNPDASAAVRKLIVGATNSDAFRRFIPLPELVKAPAAASKPAEALTIELDKLRRGVAAELLDLARRSASATPPQWGLACESVRNALERDSNQAEARRLLGYEPYEGGWARPFAIHQLRLGFVLHPTYGWVSSSWVPKLEAGQLPAPPNPRRPSEVRWLPAAEADRLRADGNPSWRITTEHFEIQSNVPLSESITFGRRLEAFHELFYTVMADVIGTHLPMAARFRSPSLPKGEAAYRPHKVYYFATKSQYLNYLRRIAPPDIDKSLGYYDPPKPGEKNRKTAYFFRDEGGQIEGTATLYHEVSHQLLFESPLRHAYKKNVGNYWVFEGLGTFFETVQTDRYGAMEVGGFVGPRIAEAVKQLGGRGNAIPTELFVSFNQDLFNLETQIYTNYQQAMALTLFLMRWQDGIYRDAFLDYVGDAVKGTLKPNSGRSLHDRLGKPYGTIDAQFLEFLKARDAEIREPDRKEPKKVAEPVVPGS